MSSTFGNVLHVSIFGQSHSPAIGCSLDGIPAGITVDQEQLQAFLDRRAPGRDETATKRREADTAHVIAGIVDGHTTGAPIAAIIENTNTRSKDYSELRRKPRPGHADFPARVKYHNMHDVAGGILGGISTGAPVMWRMAVKPTPSIGREQQTVDMDAMENAELSVHGRHDPCIVPRAVPVAEAAAALAIWDALLEDAAQR